MKKLICLFTIILSIHGHADFRETSDVHFFIPPKKVKNIVPLFNSITSSLSYAIWTNQILNGSGTKAKNRPLEKEFEAQQLLRILSLFDLSLTRSIKKMENEIHGAQHLVYLYAPMEKKNLNSFEISKKAYFAAINEGNPEKTLKRILPNLISSELLPTFILALGKAAPSMAETVRKNKINAPGILITNDENFRHVENFLSLPTGHPYPDHRGLKASKKVEGFLRKLNSNDHILILLSALFLNKLASLIYLLTICVFL